MTLFLMISRLLIELLVMWFLLLDVWRFLRLLSPHLFIILSRRRAISLLLHIEFILIITWLNQALLSWIWRAPMSIVTVATFFLIFLKRRSASRTSILSSTSAPPSIASSTLAWTTTRWIWAIRWAAVFALFLLVPMTWVIPLCMIIIIIWRSLPTPWSWLLIPTSIVVVVVVTMMIVISTVASPSLIGRWVVLTKLLMLLMLLLVTIVTHLRIHLVGVVVVGLLVWLLMTLKVLMVLEMHWKLVIWNKTWLGLIISTFELSLVPLSLAELGIISWEALIPGVRIVHP